MEQPLHMALAVKESPLREPLLQLRQGEPLHIAQAEQLPFAGLRHGFEKPLHPAPVGAAAGERRSRARLLGADLLTARVQRIQLPLQMLGLLPERLLPRLKRVRRAGAGLQPRKSPSMQSGQYAPSIGTS